MSTAIVERDDAAAESVRQTNETTTKQPRKIAIKVSTVLTALIITGLAAATCVFAGLYWSTASDLSDRDARAADTKHAQQLATDYAIGASTIDYRDAKAWFDKLKINTTPSLPLSSTPPPHNSSKSCCRCNGPPRPPRSPQ